MQHYIINPFKDHSANKTTLSQTLGWSCYKSFTVSSMGGSIFHQEVFFLESLGYSIKICDFSCEAHSADPDQWVPSGVIRSISTLFGTVCLCPFNGLKKK